MSATKKAKKLPAVWISFGDVGVEWATIRKPSYKDMQFNMIGPVHRYTPAKPAKVCRWEPHGEFDWWKFSCDPNKITIDKPRIYCPYCCGKIRCSK